ncbi:MAG TPA: hypothetical protein DE315_03835 [Candidatus Omnitrophica bacterium]|nr:hypothetical protein [Candidatus Omnitrophota bacterium]HCI44644.1 hypothetical protein [Candidatus Omnitrophota bacterium]
MKRQNNKEVRGREVRGRKRKKEEFFSVIFVSCFLLLCFFCGGCSRPDARTADQVCFGDKCVQVEVVRKEEELHRGLQFRTSLAPDGGMLFVFQKSGPYAFWMKDTLIPLDMIWMDSERRIVHIEHNVPPCAADPCPRYPPSGPALYVLEINAGFAAKLGLKVGDTMEFRLKEAEK